MKKLLFVSILLIGCILLNAQKVNIEIIETKNASASEWQLLNENYQAVSASYQFIGNESVNIVLEPNKRYYFHVSFYEIYNPDTIQYEVKVDGITTMAIGPVKDPGDHYFPFITGLANDLTKITGGTNADISEFPWQVYFISGNYRCGGSIIAKEWILTAAHCTKDDKGGNIPAAEMSVIVGANNPYDPFQSNRYGISEVIVHEKYNSVTLENDLALLKLKKPVENKIARPIKLISSYNVNEGATNPGIMAWVTGWGLTKVSPETFPSFLQKVQVPIVSNLTASLVYKNIPSTVIMAGYISGNKDACNGDSGGPLIVQVSDEFKLAGIVSWGSSSCNSFGGYTRVSSFGTWIRSKTGIPEEFVPPKPSGDSIICQNTAKGSYSIESLVQASGYRWKLLPQEAGSITWNSNNATVVWNQDYIGPVNIRLQVNIDSVLSEWSVLRAKLVKNTKLLSQSGDTALCALQPLTINVSTEGYNIIYEWYKDGNLLLTTNKNELTFPSASPANSGVYKSKITGSCGSVFSENTVAIVHPLTKISSVSANENVSFGDNITLEVGAEGYDLSYKWQKDGKLLENSNTPVYFLSGANAGDIGLYNVTVAGTCGTETSDSIYVYVKTSDNTAEPDIFIWPSVTDGKFNIAPASDDYYDIDLYNSMGKIVYRQTKCRYQSSVDISGMGPGIYIARISNRTYSRSLKVIRK